MKVILSQEPRLSDLTQRERQVVDLIVSGATNKEAARALGISPRTIEVHRARAMEKLRAGNTVDLVRIAMRLSEQSPGELPYASGRLSPPHRIGPLDEDRGFETG